MAQAATQTIRPDLAVGVRRLGTEKQVAASLIALLALFLLVAIALPLWALLSKSFQNAGGAFVGLANYHTYFTTPTLVIGGNDEVHTRSAAWTLHELIPNAEIAPSFPPD